MEISYYDPYRVCVTKKDFPKNILVDEDVLEIPLGLYYSSKLVLGELDLDFYVHQKGQLLKRIKHPDFHLDRGHIKAIYRKFMDSKSFVANEIKLTVRSIDVMRKRPDSTITCDPRLYNEDQKLIDAAISAVKCIPPFMERFSNSSTLIKRTEVPIFCNQTQYKRLFTLYRDFAKVQSWYTQPCNEMSSIVTTTESITDQGGRLTLFGKSKINLRFRLTFFTESYRETVNKLAFDMASLWSQIGGFVGIFLGYSLLQIPELVGIGVVRIKSIFRSKWLSMFATKQCMSI